MVYIEKIGKYVDKEKFKTNLTEYFYTFLNCYSLCNIFNDFQEKENKKILILGFNKII